MAQNHIKDLMSIHRGVPPYRDIAQKYRESKARVTTFTPAEKKLVKLYETLCKDASDYRDDLQSRPRIVLKYMLKAISERTSVTIEELDFMRDLTEHLLPSYSDYEYIMNKINNCHRL